MNDNEVRIRQNPVILNKECYVAFLDVLGFKEIINKWEPSKIREMLEGVFTISNLLKSCRATSLGRYSQKAANNFNELHKNLFIYIMSDSIVLAIERSNERNLHFLLYACDFIQKYFFDQYEVLLRGGISNGWFYGQGSIAFGEGFVKAYKLEGIAEYPRVIVDNDLKQVLEDECNEWSYRLHNESDYYSVDWLYNLETKPNDLKDICKQNIIQYGGVESIKKKYQWILDRICHQ